MGYHGHFQKKKREHAADGCAIFYQTCRFTLIDVQAFAYNERIPADMPEDLRARLSPFSNIALVCIFQNRQSRAQKVRMVTTHLHWDPAFADIKLLQASLLIEWLESTNAVIPTVIAGDFNSKPGEPVMDYLVRGKVCLSKPKTEQPVEGDEAAAAGAETSAKEPTTTAAAARSISPVLMDILSVSEIESEDAKSRMNAFAIQRQGVKLASAYNTRDLPFTNKTPDFEGVIDHILYSSGTLSIRDVLCDVYIPELVSASVSPTQGMSPPTSSSVPPTGDEKLSAIPTEHLQIAQYGMSSYLTRLPSLPSRRFPSDHVSLCAWLKWKTVPVLSGAQKPHQGGAAFGVSKKTSARVHGADAAGRGLSQSVPTSWVSLEDVHRNQGGSTHRGQGGRNGNANKGSNDHKSSRKQQLYNPSMQTQKDLDAMGMSGLSLDPNQFHHGSYNSQQGHYAYQPQHQTSSHGGTGGGQQHQGRRRGSNASATSNPGFTHQGSYPSSSQGFFQQHPQQQQQQQQQGHSHKKF